VRGGRGRDSVFRGRELAKASCSGQNVRRKGELHGRAMGLIFGEKGEAIEVVKREALVRELGQARDQGGAPRSEER
jgi:hypothetical protein